MPFASPDSAERWQKIPPGLRHLLLHVAEKLGSLVLPVKRRTVGNAALVPARVSMFLCHKVMP